VRRGVDPDRTGLSTDLARYMVQGRPELLKDEFAQKSIEPDEFGARREVSRAGIIIGKELAFNLMARVGDPVTITSPMGHMTPMGMTPIQREFYVAGVFHAGMYEFDSSLAFISLSQSQSLFKMGEKVSGVEVRVDDVYEAPVIAGRIQELIGPAFTARDWQDLNRNLFFALALEKKVLGLILILIIFVAAFNIISTLIMVVLEKTKDIAILKAMGASRGAVMRIFFYEGLTIGLLGTALGVAGGVILCALLERYEFIKLPSDVYNLETLPVSMQIADVVAVSAVALVVTVIAALYPAWSASRIDPAESLRYE